MAIFESTYVEPTVPCKHCGTPTTFTSTCECNRCWMLRSRVESDVTLARRFLDAKVPPAPAPEPLDSAELAAVLAGLRMIQRRGVDVEVMDIFTEAGAHDGLNDDEIDALCIKLDGAESTVPAQERIDELTAQLEALAAEQADLNLEAKEFGEKP